VKAGRVKGLRPGSKLGGAARRIAKQRVADMLQFDAAVRDPANVPELHDLRIAAKRLRYTLEVLAGALGPAAALLEDEARALQDVLGEVHDCDVLTPRLEQELARLVASDAAEVAALDWLWPYVAEIFEGDGVDEQAASERMGPRWSDLRDEWRARFAEVIVEAGLALPAERPFRSTGKNGRHSEHLGYILAEMQHLQRAFPGGVW